MTRRYVWWYWLLHKITGKPVVLFGCRHGGECLRLVRYRLKFGVRRPCAWRLGDLYVLLEGGEAVDSVADLEQWHREYNDRWKPMWGKFKPSVVAPAGDATPEERT